MSTAYVVDMNALGWSDSSTPACWAAKARYADKWLGSEDGLVGAPFHSKYSLCRAIAITFKARWRNHVSLVPAVRRKIRLDRIEDQHRRDQRDSPYPIAAPLIPSGLRRLHSKKQSGDCQVDRIKGVKGFHTGWPEDGWPAEGIVAQQGVDPGDIWWENLPTAQVVRIIAQ